jgi:hypothetical protein
MKQYLIFGGGCYYANGGFNDLVTDADTKEEALTIATDLVEKHKGDYNTFDWWQIVDTTTRQIVERSKQGPTGSSDSDEILHEYKDGVLVLRQEYDPDYDPDDD